MPNLLTQRRIYAPENPRCLSRLELWLDAGDASTMRFSGTGLSEWQDKSGNGRTMFQSTQADMPTVTSANTINGIPVPNFDGLTQFMQTVATVSMNQPMAIFCVIKTSSAQSGTVLAPGASSPALNLLNGILVRLQSNNASNLLTLSSGVTSVISIVRSVSVAVGDSRTWARLNGRSPVLGISGTIAYGTQTIICGKQNNNTSFYQGMLAELILCHTASVSQVAAVESYLIQKWGTTT